MSLAEQVVTLATPLVAARDCSLYDVTVTGGKVVVYVHRAGGVDLDTLAVITQELSNALDRDDPVPGSYTLEVSSPGLERPLRTSGHFAGAVGEIVTVKKRAHVAGERRVRGVLVEASDDEVAIRDEESDDVHRIATVDIDSARTVFDWSPPPKPGKGGSRPRPKSQQPKDPNEVRS